MGDDLTTIAAKLDRLTEGQAETRARLEVSLEQHSKEIAALFRLHSETGKDLAEVKQAACLRTELDRCDESHERQHEQFRTQIAEIREEMAPLVSASARRAAVWSAVITAAVTQAANWILMATFSASKGMP